MIAFWPPPAAFQGHGRRSCAASGCGAVARREKHGACGGKRPCRLLKDRLYGDRVDRPEGLLLTREEGGGKNEVRSRSGGKGRCAANLVPAAGGPPHRFTCWGVGVGGGIASNDRVPPA